MKQFLSAMRGSYGFVPIAFAGLLLAYCLFPNLFNGRPAHPPLSFAVSLVVFGIVWTLYFQRRAK